MNHLERLFKKDEGTLTLKKDEAIEAAITALSTVCQTDYKASEIEIGICSPSEEGGSQYRTVSTTHFSALKIESLLCDSQMSTDEIDGYLQRLGEKD